MTRLPYSTEWQAIQGGEPFVLLSPNGRLFEVVHHTGAIVPTPREQMLGSLVGSALVHLTFPEISDDDIVVPPTLLWSKHGQPCEEQAGSSNKLYDRLDPAEIEGYTAKRQAQGWTMQKLRAR